MNKQQKQLISDNPNLSSSVLAELAGIKPDRVCEYRRYHGIKPKWHHKGVGAPYLFFDNDKMRWAVGSGRYMVTSKSKVKLIEIAHYYTAIRERL